MAGIVRPLGRSLYQATDLTFYFLLVPESRAGEQCKLPRVAVYVVPDGLLMAAAYVVLGV